MTALLRPLQYSILGACALVQCAACSPFTTEPIPGPDKQFEGTFYGAMAGAGAGAVTGFEVSAVTGPGAWVGAGFGAVFGMLSGLGLDLIEEDELRRIEEEQYLREASWVHEVLTEHYARRMELHPNRDIYPADWFFDGDSVKLKPEACLLVKEIAHLTRRRMPWSRIMIAAYNTSRDAESTYTNYLTKRRAEELALEFVRAGMEPRRIVAKGITSEDAVLLDPDDAAGRYRQAVEIIPLDY